MTLQVHQVAGLEYLALVTELLQTARKTSATGGLWEAADLQWWWRRDQHPDPALQTFWFAGGAPLAAFVFTNWGDRWECTLIGAQQDSSDVMSLVWPRAAQQIDALRGATVEIAVRDDDIPLIEGVEAAGFRRTDEAGVETWMPVDARPSTSALLDGFELLSRTETSGRPHHMIGRNGVHVADRLAECSLYDPHLDLAVYAANGDVAAYGLFWADRVTGVGLVEPMRTEERYQGLGLGRHVLAAGLDRLAARGCSRFKVYYVTGNEASRRLYRGAGFHPGNTVRTYRRAATG